MKLTIGSYSKALLPSTVINNGQRSDFVGQNFLYFLFNANITNAEAVSGDSDDSAVVAGDASYVSSSSLLLLLSAVSHNAFVWALSTHVMEWLTAARNCMRLYKLHPVPTPSFNCLTPPIYTFNSLVFHSRVFHPCYLVPRFPLPVFSPWRWWKLAVSI